MAPGTLLPSLPSPGSRDGLCGLPGHCCHPCQPCHPPAPRQRPRELPAPGLRLLCRVFPRIGDQQGAGMDAGPSAGAAARSLSPGEAGWAPGGAGGAARLQGLGHVGRWAGVTMSQCHSAALGNRGSRSRMPQSTHLPRFCHFFLSFRFFGHHPALQTWSSQPRAQTPVGVPPPSTAPVQCPQRVRSRQRPVPCPPAQPRPHLEASVPPWTHLHHGGSTMEGHRGVITLAWGWGTHGLSDLLMAKWEAQQGRD